MTKYKKGSFITVPNIKKLEKLNDAYAIATFMNICRFANDKGECWPSVATLAKLCGCGKSTINLRLNKLEEYGFVRRIIRKKKNSEQNTTNLYQILIEPEGTKDKKKQEFSDESECVSSGTPPDGGGTLSKRVDAPPDGDKLNSVNQTQLTKSTYSICNSENKFSVSPEDIKKNTEKLKKIEKREDGLFQPEREIKLPSVALGPSFNWKTPEGVYADYFQHCVEMGPRAVWNAVERENHGEKFISMAELNVSGEDFAEIIMAMMNECVSINPSGKTLCYTHSQWQALEYMAEDRNIGLNGFQMAVYNIKHYQEFEEAKNENPEMINKVGVNLTNIDTPVSIRNEFRKIVRYDSKRGMIEE